MLTFLLQQASKVYALFGYLWDRIKDVALNALNWAKAEAAKALSAARTWAWERVQDLRAWANDWIGWLKPNVPVWIDALEDKVFGWVFDIQVWAGVQLALAKITIFGWIKAAKDSALVEIGKAAAGLRETIGLLGSNLNQIAATLTHIVLFVNSIRYLFTPENIRRLVLVLVNFFPSLLALVMGPLAWLYSTIAGTFVTFLCYILAAMMGTVKYTLPPPPDWLTGAGGIFTPGGPGLDPSGGELAPPLGHLSISGYRFGPGHPGLDLGLSRGAAVYAMHDGEVEVAEMSKVGYGLTITLRNGKWWTRYAHLDSFGVEKGDTVSQRQKIAEGNSTGNSTGDHLHLEIKKNGVFIDPEAVLF